MPTLKCRELYALGLDPVHRLNAARVASLKALASQVDGDAAGSKDPARVKAMAAEIRRMAAASSSK